MCDNIIDLIIICFKRSGSEIHFLLAWKLSRPPREMVYTEHLATFCLSIIVLEAITQRFVVRGLQYAVLNIVATGAAERKELLAAQFVDISTHKVVDIVADFVSFTSVEIDDLKLLAVESVKVFVIAVNVQNSKRLFTQPFEPVALILVVVPNATKVSADDYEIILSHFFLLGKILCAEAVKYRVSISCNVYHLLLLSVLVFFEKRIENGSTEVFLDALVNFLVNALG